MTKDKNSLWGHLKSKVFSGPAGAVFRGMATLAIGSIAARIIGVVSIPIITRLYTPEDFGALAVFTSFIFILAPVVTLRYVLAMPLPRRDGMAINLLVLSFCIMIAMILLLTLVLWGYGAQLLSFFSMEQLSPYWWLIILGLVGTSIYEILTLWATRRRAYKSIAQTTAIQSLSGNLAKICLGLLAIKPLGLLIGQVISASGGVVSLWLRFKGDFAANTKFVTRRSVGIVSWRYRHFPMYRLPSQFLLVFSLKAPLLFAAVIYDAQTTGQIALALMILAVPVNLLGDSMSKAYYAEISKIGRKDPDKIRTITYSVIKRLAAISILPAIVLALFGEQLFSLLFGSEWSQAGNFSEVLAIYLVFQFLQLPVSRILFVFEGHRLLLALNIQRTLLIVCCFSVAYYLNMRAEKLIFIYSTLLSAHYVTSIFYTLRAIPKNRSIQHSGN